MQNAQQIGIRLRAIRSLRRITESPLLNVLVGVIFLSTGLLESIDTLETDLAQWNFHTHHGAIIFGLFHALKHLPDVFEGVEYLQKEVPNK